MAMLIASACHDRPASPELWISPHLACTTHTNAQYRPPSPSISAAITFLNTTITHAKIVVTHANIVVTHAKIVVTHAPHRLFWGLRGAGRRSAASVDTSAAPYIVDVIGSANANSFAQHSISHGASADSHLAWMTGSAHMATFSARNCM